MVMVVGGEDKTNPAQREGRKKVHTVGGELSLGANNLVLV
jgi:hypothetical protein